MICHMQAGSVRVSAGQRVVALDVLGLLGNSGDTNFPHVHYQLMDGTDWMRCDALPYRFTNGPKRHVRGTFFDAKG
jgi:murein DD-endopeptidase MepM/ murein hydrolase activator NlpD